MFTVYAVRCVGACGLAPVIITYYTDKDGNKVDEVDGKIGPDDCPAIVEKFRAIGL
jgi:NADH:ubiquinone oxidoreductase subunit E